MATSPAREHDETALTLQQHETIDMLLEPLRAGLGRDCLSEFAFSNLYLFRAAHDYRFLPGPWPCVAGQTYDGMRHLLPLFDLAAAPVAVLRELLHGYDGFFPVPEAVAHALDGALFHVTDCDDDADYLYRGDGFRTYRGDLLRKKAQLMRQLLRQSTVSAHALTPDRIADARSLLAGWMRDKHKTSGQADDGPCREALELIDRFGFDALIFYADGEPAGFIVAQRLGMDTAVMRFAKGSDCHRGIYQYMFHHYCMQSPDLAWINFEQDLGLPNFRQTKRSYQPHAMLKKCRVSLRAT